MCILFFNWYGYRMLSSYLENRADKQLEAQLDENQYDESQLLSVKIPSTHLSYYNSSTAFERVDGQVEIGGVLYKYVKRRIYNDSLEYLCIPNHAAMSLQTAKNDFFQLVNDLRHNGQEKKGDSHPGTSKSPTTPEYLVTTGLSAAASFHVIDITWVCDPTATLPSTDASPAEQPPDHTSIV
jgi:hypothetical protein